MAETGSATPGGAMPAGPASAGATPVAAAPNGTGSVSTGPKGTGAKGTGPDDPEPEGVVVLYDGDTARVRLPTVGECAALRLGPDTPIWVIARSDGGTEVYPGDSTVIVPAE